VKTRPDALSPWKVRLYYETREFEAMMSELILRVDTPVFVAGKGVDVDLVLFKALSLEADYVDLEEGVLGRTLFRSDGKVSIEIARSLVDEAEVSGVARRRFRTTLAHEAGHVTAHRQLFLKDTETLSLFSNRPGEAENPAILCRETATELSSYSGEWWEYQANQCMGALLLPKHFLSKQLDHALAVHGVDSFEMALRLGHGESVARGLANIFDVNGPVVLFRLQQMGLAPRSGDANQKRMAL